MARGAYASSMWNSKWAQPGVEAPVYSSSKMNKTHNKMPKKYNKMVGNSSLPIPPPPPPPGLAQEPEPVNIKPTMLPPGSTAVQVSSLPNHILSHAMMSAILEQSQLDGEVSHFVTRPGAHGSGRGEAVITLTSAEAAERCSEHFHGRRWDQSGIMVRARILSRDGPQTSDGEGDACLDDQYLLAKYESRMDKENGWDAKNEDTFGESYCDHDDLLTQVFDRVNVSSHFPGNSSSQRSAALSADAPEFVPSKKVSDACDEAAVPLPSKLLKIVTEEATTDASTEDGESVSSCCDEKDRTTVKA